MRRILQRPLTTLSAALLATAAGFAAPKLDGIYVLGGFYDATSSAGGAIQVTASALDAELTCDENHAAAAFGYAGTWKATGGKVQVDFSKALEAKLDQLYGKSATGKLKLAKLEVMSGFFIGKYQRKFTFKLQGMKHATVEKGSVIGAPKI